MKTLLKSFLMCSLVASALFYLSGCNNEDDPGPQLTGESKTYDLSPVSNSAVSGTVTFAKRDDAQVLITIQLSGTQSGAMHPAHIHANSAAEGGPIVLDLTAVNGADGKSETVVNSLNDGTDLSYDDLLSFDGYVNVHLSEDNLGTLIAQGDIGENELTGENKVYTLTPVADPAVTGTATFAKRKKGTTLVTVALTGTQPGTYASHIHSNTIAETGGIVINLNSVDGTSGMARTSVDTLNDGTAVNYEQLLDFNGYLNVHTGSTFVVQGDIGQNELTGDKKVYTLTPVADPAVTGTATFAKRKNGTTLVTVALTGTQPGTYASHIHANTIAETGGIVINLTSVNGTTGMAQTSVKQLNAGGAITYDDLLNFDGYLNVHTGSTFVVQGDIGRNELTGDKKVYTLTPVADPSVTGTATFAKRKNGTTLVTVALTGTQPGTYASHIHANTIAETGGIVINLTSVNGTTGMAQTSVKQLNAGGALTYDDLLNFNGYLNVHTGSTFVVQGDIGQNELTGNHQHYTLNEAGASGVTGMATFEERKNGKALITIALEGTTAGGDHPAHIHADDVATGGGIVLDLKNVNGTTGISATSINALNSGTAITYAELVAFDGHINVHLSPTELATLIAQGDIGSNAQ